MILQASVFGTILESYLLRELEDYIVQDLVYMIWPPVADVHLTNTLVLGFDGKPKAPNRMYLQC